MRLQLIPLNIFKDSIDLFCWPIQGSASFVDPFCYISVMLSCLFLAALIVITCWERADLLALLCILVFLSLSYMVFRVRCDT